MSAIKSVIVRMYRRLLGDCFLLRVIGNDGKANHILIDCGILQNVDGDKELMQEIAEDIRQTTHGTIDLLVITHQHHDHISGFSHARDILLNENEMKYGAIWMAWTEDPSDKDAKRLRESFSRRKLAMVRVAMALDGQARLLDDLTRDLQNFIGPIDPAGPGLAAALLGRLTGDRIMEELKKAAPSTFLSPGEVTKTPGPASLPVAVLAPPRSDSRLFKDLPSKGADQETYLGEQLLEYSLLGLGSGGDAPGLDRNSPFSSRFSKGLTLQDENPNEWGKSPADTRGWIFDHYYAATDVTGQQEQDYRRIDDVWSGAASSLALKLDSDTNNTSLVLAFKLPDGTFLLFAADAQVGNWLSWHDQTYSIGNETLSASDILGKTRLYKVGHHGSHNATLKAKGLDLMTHGELVAMISTVSEIAEEQGKPPGWQMPAREVDKALLERCQGRVLRGDRKWAEDVDTLNYRNQPEFKRRLKDSSPLYVEYEAFGSAPSRSGTRRGTT